MSISPLERKHVDSLLSNESEALRNSKSTCSSFFCYQIRGEIWVVWEWLYDMDDNIYWNIPAPTKRCQYDPKGWLMGTPAPIHLAPLRCSRYIYIYQYYINILLFSWGAKKRIQIQIMTTQWPGCLSTIRLFRVRYCSWTNYYTSCYCCKNLLLLKRPGDFYDVNDWAKLISISSYMIQIQRSQWQKKSGTPPQNMQSAQGVL